MSETEIAMNGHEELPRYPFDSPLSPDEEPVVAGLRGEQPVIGVRLPDQKPAWLVTRDTDVRRVLTDEKFSRAAANALMRLPGTTPDVAFRFSTDLLINMDPPRHHRVKRLVMGALSPWTEKMSSRMERLAGILTTRMAEGGPPADLVTQYALPLASKMFCELLGVPEADHERFHDWALTRYFDFERGPEAVTAAFLEMDGYLVRLVERRRAEPADDHISALIQARGDEGTLSDEEIRCNVLAGLIAGLNNIALSLVNGVLVLFRHPDQLGLLRAKPGLLPGAVEELLRYSRFLHLPAPRIATGDVELSGTPVRAGDVVIADIHSADRDPRTHNAPGVLDIQRAGDPPTLAFGHGTHICAAAELSRRQLRIGLGTLLTRFPGMRPVFPVDEPDMKPPAQVRALKSLRVTW